MGKRKESQAIAEEEYALFIANKDHARIRIKKDDIDLFLGQRIALPLCPEIEEHIKSGLLTRCEYKKIKY